MRLLSFFTHTQAGQHTRGEVGPPPHTQAGEVVANFSAGKFSMNTWMKTDLVTHNERGQSAHIGCGAHTLAARLLTQLT